MTVDAITTPSLAVKPLSSSYEDGSLINHHTYPRPVFGYLPIPPFLPVQTWASPRPSQEAWCSVFFVTDAEYAIICGGYTKDGGE